MAMSPAAAPVPGGGPINGSNHSVPGNTGPLQRSNYNKVL